MIKTPIKSPIKNWLKKSTISNLSTSSIKPHFCLPTKISSAINRKFLSKVYFVLCRFTDFGASGLNQDIPGRTPKSSYYQAKQSEIQSDRNRTHEIRQNSSHRLKTPKIKKWDQRNRWQIQRGNGFIRIQRKIPQSFSLSPRVVPERVRQKQRTKERRKHPVER